VAKFFLEPAEHIGEALNKLIKAAFTGLPFYHYITVFVLIIILMVLCILVCSGYRIRTLLFNIEPHRPPVDHITHRLAELEDENKRLQQSVESQKQLQCSCGIASIEAANRRLLQLDQTQREQLQQQQLPQGMLRDRLHQRSIVQQVIGITYTYRASIVKLI